MTVGQLIAALSEHPQDLEIVVVAFGAPGQGEAAVLGEVDGVELYGDEVRTLSLTIDLHG